ncbi:MAG: YihY/virulence factor BrkB family protein, partial [Phycisphaerae bacterium]|nr:YihY/virulence factor BrkB family protein [Gemmatimonadaceae bacterium]
NVFFLAGGLAFNILLALVPFALLLISGISFVLGREPEDAASTIIGLIDSLLPRDAPAPGQLLRELVAEIMKTRGTVGFYSAISFAWFSTRLFGSLRSVLALIFDGSDRGIVAGKLFDLGATIVSTMTVAAYVVFSAYLTLATTRGAAFLVSIGLAEGAMGTVSYLLGRVVAVAVIIALFFSLYRGLPRRRPSVRTSFVAATTAGILFELARYGFALLVKRADPSSLYTGTIAAVVGVVFWVYYAALLFLIGGEVAQAYDLRKIELKALQQTKENDAHTSVPAT